MAGSRWGSGCYFCSTDFSSESVDEVSIIWRPVFIIQRIKSELSCAKGNSSLLMQGGRSNGVFFPEPSKQAGVVTAGKFHRRENT